jgi:hypothetical protein
LQIDLSKEYRGSRLVYKGQVFIIEDPNQAMVTNRLLELVPFYMDKNERLTQLNIKYQSKIFGLETINQNLEEANDSLTALVDSGYVAFQKIVKQGEINDRTVKKQRRKLFWKPFGYAILGTGLGFGGGYVYARLKP